MIEYILSFPFIRDVILSILNFLILQYNTEIKNRNLDTTISITINYHDAVFFSHKPGVPKNVLDIYYTDDSAYITKKSNEYFDLMGTSDKLRRNIAETNFYKYFGFFFGRFLYNSDFENFRIDITAEIPDTDIVIGIFSKKGKWIDNLEFGFYTDTLNFSENNKKLLKSIGEKNFHILFTTAHELNHFLSFLESIKINGKNYEMVKQYVNRYDKESHMDDRARYILDRYAIQILEIYNK